MVHRASSYTIIGLGNRGARLTSPVLRGVLAAEIQT